MILTTDEKSLLLAKAMGSPLWVLDPRKKQIPGELVQTVNLYDPANAALLAHVIEWVCNGEMRYQGWANWEEGYFDAHFNPKQFHKSMCAMADAILAEVIEARLVAHD